VTVWHRLAADERGMGGVEVLPFGVLTFVIGGLLIANAWGVVDAKIATTAAAREAARAYVEAPGARQAVEAADAAARASMAGHGRDPARVEVEVDGTFVRCAPVLAEVSYPVPAIRLPWIGGYGEVFEVRARHSEVVDPFRSGDLGPGEAICG
jgi:hypothetical protein